ncbi:DNA-binding protein [Candidatus Uhrbacteria bacterium RIFCSPHIGHO2_01_FULL_63_20]|uniref:DNA-binding protein n=1 Tax=Candidatus Uhrbacteria bacterium RIFCSPHIGHO2_01_FULL_63_20 TaxID=1802385 RepID=A0A1F7TMF3_9BACT|nr:MAG: DNA-binding protein [Candidatus Uhrbacteria bacterium RIFCSPHIGHO2_01_FULL_63_20]
MPELIPHERIEGRIYLIRGKKVMLDRDLAALYGVKTQVLNQAVKRNADRFLPDFMFELSDVERRNLISQIVISSSGYGGTRRATAFTEQGIAMLSGVLNSKRAIAVNIQIIRTFTKLREMISENHSLRLKLEALEKHYDEQFRVVFDAIRRLLADDDNPKPEIGFRG